MTCFSQTRESVSAFQTFLEVSNKFRFQFEKEGNKTTFCAISQTAALSVSVGFTLRLTKLKNGVSLQYLPPCLLNVSHMFQLSPVFHGALNVVILFPRSVSLL